MRYLIAVSLIWAFSFGLIKTQLAGWDPLAVAAVRMLLAAVAFAPWLSRGPRGAARRGRLMLLGAVQFGLMYICYIAAFGWLPAYAVALFTVTTPFYVLAMTGGGPSGRRRRNLAGAVLAVAGAAWTAWRALPASDAWLGILLLQLSNISFAAGQVLYRRLRRGDPRAIGSGEAGGMAWMYLGAAALTAAAAVIGGKLPAAPTGSSLAALFYLGLIPSALAFHLWNKGAARASAGGLAVANNLKIPLAVVAAWTVFGESAPYLRAGLGLAAVIGGLLLADLGGPDRRIRNRVGNNIEY